MSLKLSASSSNLRFSHASSPASLDTRLPKATAVPPWFEERKGRIAKLFERNEISISTYDTAWVSMVPSPFSKANPCFPDSLLWLLENQCPDGSWARPHHHCLLKKDVLSSTLASVLALKKWGLGQQHIDKGLHFLELNFGSATDESQITPMGFEIIFPAMLDEARALSMNPSLEQSTLNDVMNLRDLELRRIYSSRDKEAYMAYIGEGLMGKMELNDIMKYQIKNGSLFSSPSTTAAASIALPNNSRCLNYLNRVVNKFGGAVPAVYPLDIYSQLCTVDSLERLGISRFFMEEIRNVLDQTYRCWLLGDEEIFMDASTCALAFKILRMNGYHVTSDAVTKVIQEHFPTSVQRGLMTNVETTLELFRASELMLHPGEEELENQNLKLRSVLEHELSSASIKSSRLNAEVKHALDFPFYAILERMATRKNIEHYNFDNTRMLKTSYCLPNLGNKDVFLLSVEDFNRCQAIHREEFKEFERWFLEHRLDEVKLAKQKFVYCYFSAAAAFFAPELSDARMVWAKSAIMVSISDDLYDVRGSYEEKKKLTELVNLWDVDVSTEECCSNYVKIIFSALKDAVGETAEKGSKLQGRDVTGHVLDIWQDCLNASMKEAEWEESNCVPTFDEYMSSACLSFGLGPIVLLPLYLMGPKLSEEMINHPEYHRLFDLMCTPARLVNDVCSRGLVRESQHGKVGGLALYIAENGGGKMSTEAAVVEMMSTMRSQRRELLKLILDDNYTSALPKPCKELIWAMTKVNQVFYREDDGFWSTDLTQVVPEILQHPIVLE